ncbi:unnamed protein product, partial [Rotaria sp. Silwood2]
QQDPPPYQNNLQANRQSLNYYRPAEERMVDFQELVARYEINHTFATKLRALEGYEIVFICDDSGSMNTPLGYELKQTISIVIDLASVFDPDDVDVCFLNCEPVFHVRNSEQLVPIFAVRPSDPTPIVSVFRCVLRDKQHEIEERKLLILLATDGVPTDNQGHRDIRSFEYVLKQERKPTNRIPVTIIACTDSWFDDLDERKVTTDGYGRPSKDFDRKRKKYRCTIL